MNTAKAAIPVGCRNVTGRFTSSSKDNMDTKDMFKESCSSTLMTFQHQQNTSSCRNACKQQGCHQKQDCQKPQDAIKSTMPAIARTHATAGTHAPAGTPATA